MKRVLLSMVFLATLCTRVDGQHGTAPPGYYPMGYSGDTWAGEVVSTDEATLEITLTSKMLVRLAGQLLKQA